MGIPSFHDPAKAGQMFRPDEQAIAAAAAKSGWTPSHKDAKKRALLIIDPQCDFVFEPTAPFPGSLSVPGAPDDMRRTAEFIYNFGDKITNIYCSNDTHLWFQIFHPSWWEQLDADGNSIGNPAPMTLITSADIEAGKFRPAFEPLESIDYVKKLEADGKKVLMIWPYHCLEISPANSIVPILAQAMMYHSAARHAQTICLRKGNEPRTEMYGILKPEVVCPKSQIPTAWGMNTAFLDILAKHDEIYIAGEAKSHCVLETLEQMIAEFQANSPDALAKMRIIDDCMSPVPAVPGVDFPAITEARFDEFRAMGIAIIKSTDGIA